MANHFDSRYKTMPSVSPHQSRQRLAQSEQWVQRKPGIRTSCRPRRLASLPRRLKRLLNTCTSGRRSRSRSETAPSSPWRDSVWHAALCLRTRSCDRRQSPPEDTTRDDKTKEEILPENRSRQEPEKRANPDVSGRSKIPGFGGRQNLVTF